MDMQTLLLLKAFALLILKKIDKKIISKDWRPFALHGGEYRRLGHTRAHVDSGGWGKAVLLIRMIEPGMDLRELCPASSGTLLAEGILLLVRLNSLMGVRD